MASIIKNIFENNFIEKCIENSFINSNCIIGASTLFFSLLILIFNIIALFKLTHFYKTLNFETNLLLLSIFQVIIIQLVIITLYEILITFFILIQILIISLIIRKFVILSKKPVQILKKNGHFLFINTINISLFLLYIMFLFQNSRDNTYSIMLLHSLFYLLSTIILTFYSISLVKLIKKYRDSKLKVKSESISESTKENSNSYSLAISLNDILNNNEIFYSMRKQQIKSLYSINIICAFLEFLLMLSILLFPYDNFKKSQFKITPNSLLGYIIFNIYLFTCLFNVSSNFLSFFWKIRMQYKEEYNKNDNYNKQNNNRIIDNRYIKRETINLRNEEPKQVNDFIENVKTKIDQKKFAKSIYESSFTDTSEEKEEDYFVKQENKNKEENINDNLDKNKEPKNSELSVNKELLEPLNNNFIDRESIPCNIDSLPGINRNTFLTNSQFDQEV